MTQENKYREKNQSLKFQGLSQTPVIRGQVGGSEVSCGIFLFYFYRIED